MGQTHEVELSGEGIIVPRVDRTTVTGEEGQLIYDVNSDSFWYHDGMQWVEIGAASGTSPFETEWECSAASGRI